MKGIFEYVEQYRASMNMEYPQYCEITNDIFDVIIEMLSVDYLSLSSDKKKLRMVNNYLRDVFEKSFCGNGHKNYLRSILDVFMNSQISAYICAFLKTESENFLSIIRQIKYQLIYWQGFEGHEDKKLNNILDCICP